MRVIHTSKNKMFRIVEHNDHGYLLENLKGDVFNPEVNSEMSAEKLREEELDFESIVEREGVYGYVLERWNPSPGKGWEHVDSCWGFVGQYSDQKDKFDHYIVDELKGQINEKN